MIHVCKNCKHCNVKTDDDGTKRLMCTGTKKGRTLTWAMNGLITSEGDAVNMFQYFAEHLDKNKRPKWCPLEKNS